MYSGNNPFIHQLGEPGDLRLEHVAFSARGRKEFCERLDVKGVIYKEATLIDAGLIQIDIWDRSRREPYSYRFFARRRKLSLFILKPSA